MDGSDRLVKRLILTAMDRCEVCKRPYRIGNVEIIGHQDEFWFLSISCPNCKNRNLIAAFMDGRRLEIISDLTPEEKTRLVESDTVTADDVIDVHQFLKSFNGDFISLFKSEVSGTG